MHNILFFTYKKLNFIYHREMGGTPGQRVTKVLMFGMENLCFLLCGSIDRSYIKRESSFALIDINLFFISSIFGIVLIGNLWNKGGG